MPRHRRVLPEECVARLRAADAILHAGDVMELEVLEELQALGPPVHAVHGNQDSVELRMRLPATRIVQVGGRADRDDPRRRAEGGAARTAASGGSPRRTRWSSATATCRCTRSGGGFQIFNPGSPTERRRAPRHTMGVATVEDGLLAFELIPLP